MEGGSAPRARVVKLLALPVQVLVATKRTIDTFTEPTEHFVIGSGVIPDVARVVVTASQALQGVSDATDRRIPRGVERVMQ